MDFSGMDTDTPNHMIINAILLYQIKSNFIYVFPVRPKMLYKVLYMLRQMQVHMSHFKSLSPTHTCTCEYTRNRSCTYMKVQYMALH